MPYLDDEDIRRLTGMKDAAEYELDLCGLDLAHSIASVEQMIERSRFRKPRTVFIKIDPPTSTSGETLFQPIGRILVQAMKAGNVQQCRPHIESGSGFWVSLRGNLNTAKNVTGQKNLDC